MKSIIYWFILIFSILMIFAGISEVTQNGLTFIDILIFAIFISLILFSIVKLFKLKHKNLNYEDHNVKSLSKTEISQFNSTTQTNNHNYKKELNSNIKNIKTNNNQTRKQEYPLTNSESNKIFKDEVNWSEDIQENNGNLVTNVKDNVNKNKASYLNANDILVLHLNKNREVGTEIKNHLYLLENQINVDTILDKLINLNYINIKSNFDVSLSYLKIPELKDILRKNKLKLGGNKPELIERIKKNVNEN